MGVFPKRFPRTTNEVLGIENFLIFQFRNISLIHHWTTAHMQIDFHIILSEKIIRSAFPLAGHSVYTKKEYEVEVPRVATNLCRDSPEGSFSRKSLTLHQVILLFNLVRIYDMKSTIAGGN